MLGISLLFRCLLAVRLLVRVLHSILIHVYLGPLVFIITVVLLSAYGALVIKCPSGAMQTAQLHTLAGHFRIYAHHYVYC